MGAWSAAPNGTIRVRFEIRFDGAVEKVGIEENQIGMASLGCCLVARIETWRFTELVTPGRVIVSYPYAFEVAQPIDLQWRRKE